MESVKAEIDRRNEKKGTITMNTCQTCLHWIRFGNIVTVECDNGTTPWIEHTFRSRGDGIDRLSDLYYSAVLSKILDEKPAHQGLCQCTKFQYLHYDKEHTLDNDALGYCDGEGCSAYFWTGEDFGCVHHEPKVIVANGP